jgi:hypothetical protein
MDEAVFRQYLQDLSARGIPLSAEDISALPHSHILIVREFQAQAQGQGASGRNFVHSTATNEGMFPSAKGRMLSETGKPIGPGTPFEQGGNVNQGHAYAGQHEDIR